MIRPCVKGFPGDSRAATAVEFAFVFPVFVLLIFGLFEFAQALRLNNELSLAASKASRLVMIDDSISNAALETEIRSVLSRLDADTLQVTLSTQTIAGQSYRIVELSYPYALSIPFFHGTPFTLSIARGVPQGL